jgi:SagB-type dehydrogenase family enzyme
MRMEDIDFLTYALTDVFDTDDHEITEVFHEYSKLTPMTVANISQRVQQITHDVGLVRMMARAWKNYPAAEKVLLDRQAKLGEISLSDAILQRASLSTYASSFQPEGVVTLKQLSAILQYSYGATRVMTAKTGDSIYLRAAISAGSLYPLEIYPLVLNVPGLQAGLYHYFMPDHALHLVRSGDLLAELLACSSYKELLQHASVAFVITGVWKRTLVKYQQRGYRFLLNDAGALLQNFYLTSTSFGLGCCALGGFYDDQLAKLLQVNPLEEPVLIGFLLGEKPEHVYAKS